MTLVRALWCQLWAVAAAMLVYASEGHAQALSTRSAGFSGLGERVNAILIEASERGMSTWFRAIVVFRIRGPELPHGTAEARARQLRGSRLSSAWREERRANGRMICGGGGSNEWWYDIECSRGMDTLVFAGTRIPLSGRDSAVVVLIDQADVDPATWRLVGIRRVSAFPPPEYHPRVWASGDTLFTDAPARPAEILQRHLQQDPVVRSFLSEARR